MGQGTGSQSTKGRRLFITKGIEREKKRMEDNIVDDMADLFRSVSIERPSEGVSNLGKQDAKSFMEAQLKSRVDVEEVFHENEVGLEDSLKKGPGMDNMSMVGTNKVDVGVVCVEVLTYNEGDDSR